MYSGINDTGIIEAINKGFADIKNRLKSKDWWFVFDFAKIHDRQHKGDDVLYIRISFIASIRFIVITESDKISETVAITTSDGNCHTIDKKEWNGRQLGYVNSFGQFINCCEVETDGQ